MLSANGAQASFFTALSQGRGSIGPDMSRGHVVLVEDEFLISEMISEALIDDGFEVDAFDDAESALRYLVSGARVDLLLTDIDLPGAFDGATLALRAREQCPWLPVVYASAHGPGSFRTVPGGVFVGKPYSPEKVCALVRQLALAPASESAGASLESTHA